MDVTDTLTLSCIVLLRLQLMAVSMLECESVRTASCRVCKQRVAECVDSKLQSV